MKATKREFSTSRWLIPVLLISLAIFWGIDSMYATVEPQTKVNELHFFEDVNFSMIDNNVSDIQKQVETGSKIQHVKDETRLYQEKVLKEHREAEELRKKAIEEAKYSTVSVCGVSSYKKNYMDYRAISTNSRQWSLMNSYTTLRSDGLLVTDDGFVAVALGSAYGSLGSKYRVTTSTGQVFKVIKIDEKSNAHTINGCVDSSNAMIEFIIDINKVRNAYPQVTTSGDFNSLSTFNGTIVKIEKYNE